jgi:6-pyruvoyltetrahydropterin/6-carboxytetrahydropterin synthase
MVYVTRRERFNAAHRLWVNSWSEEKNLQIFGKCANKNWHGHNYDLFITIKGKPNPTTGFVMDVKKLSNIIKEVVIEQLDHKNLNMDVTFIAENQQPTTEVLAMLIWEQLEPHIEGCELHSVRLHETENIYAEYFGE